MQECPRCGARVRDDAYLCGECGAVLQAATLVSPTGFDPSRVLSDRYVLLALLGRGGMGAVWLAKDTQLDEIVAVKVLPAEVASDLRAVEWMKEEVRLARTLRHDNIAAIYSFDVDTAKQTSYIVMEFIDGVDLHSLLGRHRGGERGGGLPLGMVVDLLGGMAAALDYAHSKRVVHRDIKPKNIMVTRDGVVKVTDFGIARKLRETVSKISQTVVAGTPVYMAPEAIEGEKIDPRADVYSLGATVYELLTGEPPFHGAGMDLIYKILSKDVPHITARIVGDASLAEALTNIMRKCLAKRPEDRYATAGEFYEDFVAAVAGEISEDVLTAHRTTLMADVDTIVAEQRRVMLGPTASVAATPTAQPQHKTPSATPQAVPTATAPQPKRSRLPLVFGLIALVALGVGLFLWLGRVSGEKGDPLKEAQAAAARGDWELVAAAARKALAANPDDPVAEALLEKARRKLKAAHLLAEAKLLLGERDYENALKKAKEALALDPTNPDIPRALERIQKEAEFQAHLRDAREAEGTGRLSEAVGLLEKALSLFDEPEARRFYERLRGRLKCYEEAVKEVEKAIEELDIQAAEEAFRKAEKAWKGGPALAGLRARISRLRMRLLAQGVSLAVVDFVVGEGVGVSGRAAAEALLSALMLPYKKITPETTAGILKALGLTTGQLADMESAALLWRRRRIRFLIRGSIYRKPAGYTVKVSLVDLKEKRVLCSYSHECRDGSGILAVCRLCGRVISLPEEQRSVFVEYIRKMSGQDYEAAVRLLKKALSRYGDSELWKGAVEELKGHLLGRAHAAARLGRNRQALTLALLLLQLDPKNREATGLKAALNERIVKAPRLFAALQKGDFRHAGQIVREMERFPPNREWLRKVLEPVVEELHRRAEDSERAQKKGEAVVLARALLALRPSDREARELLGRVGGRVGDVESLIVARFVRKGAWVEAVRKAKTASEGTFAQTVYRLFSSRHKEMVPASYLGGMIGLISSLDFSPDGTLVAVCGSDGVVRLYEWRTAREKAVLKLKDEKAIVDAVAFSPDGRWLAASGTDMLVHVWERARLKEVRTLKGHKGRVSGLVWSPDSRFLLSVSWDGNVRLWDVRGGFAEGWQKRLGGLPGVCAWSPDGKVFVVDGVSGNPFAIVLFDGAGRRQKAVLTGHRNYVTALAFAPGGRLLASGGRDGRVIIWDIKAGKKCGEVVAPVGVKKGAEVVGLAWSPDGLHIAGCFSDGSLILWRVEDGKLSQVVRWDCGGGERVRRVVGGVCWHPEGVALGAAVNGRKVFLWRIPKKRLEEVRREAERLVASVKSSVPESVKLSPRTLERLKRRLLGE